MKKNIIAPSILAADCARLGEEVASVVEAGADWVHIDVMDNHYVPNLTFGPMVCQAIKPYAKPALIDVHLMVTPVDGLLEAFARAGADIIVFHPEASLHIERSLQLIKSYGLKAGIAFNPATPLSYLDYVLDKLDLILLMSVNPGFGGQLFLESSHAKIKQVRKIIDDGGYPIILEVDGGINQDNIRQIAQSGADAFVIGNAIFKSSSQQSYSQIITELRYTCRIM